MKAVLDWGVVPILWLQQQFSPTLDLFFEALTCLGTEGFYILLLPFVYWCIDRRQGARLAVALLFSIYVNAVVKSLAHQPRPFQYDSAVKRIVDAKGGGFPSGHTQGTTVVWGYLMHEFRRRWVWVVGVIMLVFVPLSRVYLGVHFPTDLLGGYVIGAVLLLMWFWLAPRVEEWLARKGWGWQLGVAVGGPLFLILVFIARDTYILIPAGTLMGLGAGIVLERQWLGFEANGDIAHRALRFALGAILLVAIQAGLKYLFSLMGEAVFFRFCRYLVVGFWIGFVSPLIFLKLRLATGRIARERVREMVK